MATIKTTLVNDLQLAKNYLTDASVELDIDNGDLLKALQNLRKGIQIAEDVRKELEKVSREALQAALNQEVE